MICPTSDVELTLDCTSQLEPFALVLGEVGTSNTQFLLYVERQMILEAKSFIDIIFDIIGTYFNFDICYPKQLLSILFFFQYSRPSLIRIPLIRTLANPNPMFNDI